ncbi:MAG: hypothetical protein ACLPQS_05045 [Acidimicrobiales bacterium]
MAARSAPDSVPARVAFVGHRLGAPDGISAASAVCQDAFRSLGSLVTTIASEGTAHHLVPLDEASLEQLLSDQDLVVVENCCSSWSNPPETEALARLLAGRPAMLRHHDLAWQAGGGDRLPPDDPAWTHITINERSRLELGARGIVARTIYHHFDMDPPRGDRERTRATLGLESDQRLLLQPTRVAASKNVAGGLLLARGIGAVYWVLGPVDEDYHARLDQLVSRAAVRVIQGRPDGVTLADAYAASDAVVLASTWEGFGNASIESAAYRRPFAIGPYPVGTELRRYGFSWFDWRNSAALDRYLADPDPFVVDRNERVARMRFSSSDLAQQLLRFVYRAVN